MQKIFYIAKAGLIAGCLCLFTKQAEATTFTAVASGNFSSSATWGGAAPSQMVTSDIVVIPASINVMLDQSATFNGLLASLVVNGTLTSSQGSDLIIQAGSFSGSGTVSADSVALGLVSGFTFTGNLNANQFTSTGLNMASSANVNVSSSLYLSSGVLSLAAGNIVLGNNSSIVVVNGSISQSGGSLNLNNAYRVWYSGSANTVAGFELSGSGLTDIDVNLVPGASVMLSSDLYVQGMLTLHAGMLNLNGNDLNFMGSGNVSASGNGTITSGPGSNISITTTNGLSGALHFTTGSNTVNNFTLNLGSNSGSVMLGGDMNINGQLQLQSGHLDAGTYDVMIAAGGTIAGGSATSYVITGAGGTLTMELAAGGSNMYAVGTSTGYAPAMVMANNGAATGNVGVSVRPQVLVNGMSGASLSTDQPLVDHTWHVTSTATANIDLNMELMWATAAEINGFNRNAAYISHYTNGSWDLSATATATATTNGMFKLTRNNVTSLSPFAVMDEQTVVTGVDDVVGNTEVNIYPNPATDMLYFTTDRMLHVAIYDLSGRVMMSVDVQNGNSGISINELPAGIYTAQMSADGYIKTERLIKQ